MTGTQLRRVALIRVIVAAAFVATGSPGLSGSPQHSGSESAADRSSKGSERRGLEP
jgi:hypothetical protein